MRESEKKSHRFHGIRASVSSCTASCGRVSLPSPRGTHALRFFPPTKFSLSLQLHRVRGRHVANCTAGCSPSHTRCRPGIPASIAIPIRHDFHERREKVRRITPAAGDFSLSPFFAIIPSLLVLGCVCSHFVQSHTHIQACPCRGGCMCS